MADNNELIFGIEADGSQASRSVKSVAEAVASLQKSFESLENKTKATFGGINRDAESLLKKMEALISQQGKITLKDELRLASQANKARSQNAAGGVSGQDTDAIVAQIVRANQTTAQKLTKAIAKVWTDNLKLSSDYVEAQLKNSKFAADRLLKNTSDQVIAARAKLADQQLEKLLRRANRGPEDLAADRILYERSQESRRAKAFASGPSSEQQAIDDILRKQQEASRANRARLGTSGAQLMGVLDKVMDPRFLAVQGIIMANYKALDLMYQGITQVTSALVQLDTQFAQLQGITGASNEEMIVLKNTILDMGSQTKFSTVELAKAAVVLGQAGLSAKQTGEALKGVALFATAAGTDFAQATDLLTSTMTTFDIAVEKSAETANLLTGALNTSKLTADSLATGLQYVGNIAASSNVSLQETVAMLGAMSNSGIRGSTAGTGLRQLMLDLSTPTDKLAATLERLGLTTDDVDVKMHGFTNVLKTLKDAGFTVGDAMDTLEVRAAAAFTTLQNNSESINRIRASLLLTTAATDAYGIQMNTLTARATQFMNVLTQGAAQAFGPLISAMKSTLAGASSLLQVLNGLPLVTSALGTAFSAVVAVGTATHFAKVVGSLIGLVDETGKAIPALARMGAMLTAVKASAIASTAGVRGLGVAVAFLAANPMLVAIGAVSAIVAGLALWNSAQDDLSEKLDEAKTRLAGYDEQITTTQANIKSVSAAIEDLSTHQQDLDKDRAIGGGEMRLKVLELKQAFTGLGLELKDNVNPTVQELIEALNNVQLSLNKNLPDYLQQKLDEMAKQQELLNEQANAQKNGISYALQGAIRGGSVFGGAKGVALSDFGPQVQRAGQIIDGKLPLPEDNTEFSKLINAANAARGDANNQGRDILDQLIKALQDLQGTVAEKQALGIKQQDTQQARLNAIANGNLNSTTLDANSLKSEITNKITGISRDYRNDPVLMEQKLNELQAAYKGRVDAIQTAIDEEKNVLLKSGNNSKQVDEAISNSGIIKLKAEIDGLVKAALSGKVDEINKIKKAVFNKKDSDTKRNINSILGRLDKSSESRDFDDAEKQLHSMFDQRRQAFRDIWKLDSGDNPSASQLQILDFGLSEIDTEEQDAMQQAADRRKEFLKEDRQSMVNLYEAQIGTLRESMSAIASTLTENSTPEKIQEVHSKMKDFVDQINKLLESVQQLKIEGINADSNNVTPINLTGSGGQSASAAMKFFIAKGLPAHAAAGLVGRMAHESAGFDPNVISGKRQGDLSLGGSFGIAQWLGPRKKALFDFAGGAGNAGNLQTQLEFAWHELMNKEKGTLNRLMRARSVEEGASAAMSYERPRGWSPSNPKGGMGWKDTLGYAKNLIGAEDVNAATSKAKQDVQSELDAIAKKNQEALNKMTISQLKSSTKSIEAELDTLSTLSGSAQTSKDLKEIIKRGHQLFTKALENDLKVFDKGANSGDKEARQNLKDKWASDEAQWVARMNARNLAITNKEIDRPSNIIRSQIDAAGKAGATAYSDVLNRRLQDAEAAAGQERLLRLTQLRAEAEAKLHQAVFRNGKDSVEARTAATELANATEQLTQAQEVQEAQTTSLSDANIHLKDTLVEATRKYMESQGVVYGAQGEINQLATNANQFGQAWNSVLEGIGSGFETFFINVASGNKTLKESLKELGKSILTTFMNVFAKLAAQKMMQLIFGGLGGGDGGGLGGLLGGLFGGAKTGVVVPGQRRAASGTVVPGARRAASGTIVQGGVANRDSVPYLLEPGEGVLNRSAVNAVGEDTINSINALGNKKRTPEVNRMPDDKPMGDRTVNVWVVSPDQVPQSGPNDIIATVASDIQQRGPLRQLIKQVSMGSM